MLFSSQIFIAVFLPVFLLVYSILPRQKGPKNAFILLASIVFYSWGGPKFIFVILGVTLLDFILVGQMDKQQTAGRRRGWLALSVGMNLGLLVYFKYLGFLSWNLSQLLKGFGGGGLPVMDILLPIGISFYTFESITYAVDVYRGVHKPLKNFWDYQLYILFFPKLIAGPIVRYHDISDQIAGHVEQESTANAIHGFVRFCIGLAKKVLIANVMGQQADLIFRHSPETLGTAAAWAGALAYTFQIYFDFSGYSDMAIGLARIMGFRLPENFNNPYTATSVTDFWRRWHISLGAWMRNYLYIPLGGNKGSRWKVYRNLALVFLASGLWHGASWNFVVWGAFHGAFLILDRLFLLRLLQRLGRLPAVLLTFLTVVSGWVIFRLEDLGQAFAYLRRMFVFDFRAAGGVVLQQDFRYLVFAAVFFSFFALLPGAGRLQEQLFTGQLKVRPLVILSAGGMVLYALCLPYVAAAAFNPFIYFKF